MSGEFENDQELEQYVQEQESGNRGPTQDYQEQAAPEKQAPVEYEYTARGKTIKEPIDQILKRASQGYDYAQSMAEFNRNKAEFDIKNKEFEGSFGLYKKIDDYAKSNPQWWESIQKQYQQQTGGQQLGNPQTKTESNDEISFLKNELMELKKFKESFEQDKNQAKIKEEDESLKKEIESIRKDYSHLDFDTPGEDGKSLYYKILEHAQAIGTSSFRVAFRDFNHDRLINLAQEKGKELVQKDMEKKTKLGLVGSKNRPPEKRDYSPREIKNMSYDDLARQGKKEFGLG